MSDADAAPRYAPRVPVVQGLEVLLDGSPATLVDVSVTGAQVVSSTVLKPNQRVRVVLPDERHPIRCAANVAWATLELLHTGPQYRAGLSFADPNSEQLTRLVERHRLSRQPSS